MKRSTPEAYRLLAEGAITLARVEENGVRVDRDYLLSAIKKTEDRIADITKELQGKKLYARWKREFGEKTNLGSRDQLAHMVFTVMGYEAKAYTTGGESGFGKRRAKADKTAFEEIDEPFVRAILKAEQLKKATSTNLHGILRCVVEHKKGHWYAHPSYHLNTVRSFRSSASDFNIQNQPVRDPDLMTLIRSCIIPSEGNEFTEIDYSAHEAKMIAVYSKDGVLIKFIKEKDMHREVAKLLFKMTDQQVSKMTRYIAKNGAVFPFFYGSAWFLIAADVWKMIHILNAKVEGEDTTVREFLAKQGITERGACDPEQEPVKGTFEHRVKRVEEVFWSPKMFGKTAEWKREFYRQYQREGGFWIKTGFWVPGHHKRNDVTNYGPQGLGFHCLLLSMIYMQKWLDKYKFKSRIATEIHDSFLWDMVPSERDDVIAKARWVMTEYVPKKWPFVNVELGTEVEICEPGASWATKKEHVLKDGKWVKK